MQIESGSLDFSGQAADAESIDAPSTANTVEALTVRQDDKDRIKKVEKYQGYKMTTSQWTKVLDYDSTSGPPGFFERNRKRGYLKCEKDPSGTGIVVRLTQQGKRILRAASF